MADARKTRSAWSVSALLVAALLVAVGFLGYGRYLMVKNRVDPGTLFAEGVPSRLKTLMAINVTNGQLGEFFDPTSKTKISFLLAKHPSVAGGAESVSGVIALIDKDRLGADVQSPVESVILKYSGAQFSVLSAGKVNPTEVPVFGKSIVAERFETTREANYLMGVINLGTEQLLFLAMKKGESVDAVLVGKLIEGVRGVTQSLGKQSA
jgi:hypothetical protein